MTRPGAAATGCATAPADTRTPADAVVLSWDRLGPPDGRTLPALRRRLLRLLAAGVDVVVLAADVTGTRRRLAVRSPGPGVLLLLAPSAAGPQVGSALESRGTTPARTLDLAGGPAGGVLAALDAELRRRPVHRVPACDPDPAWTVVREDGGEVARRITDTLFTLADGTVATRGACAATEDPDARLVLVSGRYAGHGAEQHLAPGPWWPAVEAVPTGPRQRRVLDLRAGLLFHEQGPSDADGGDALREVRFASAAVPGLLVLRAEGPLGSVALRRPPVAEPGTAPPSDTDGGFTLRTRDHSGREGAVRTVDRLAAYTTAPDGHRAAAALRARLDRASSSGVDVLLREHRVAWARRWSDVDIEIEGDAELQLAARFSLFHLWGLVSHERENAVGARGLSGTGYRGHVFWDADVFVLPALVTLDPRGARALLGYRLHRLGPARAAAREAGREGARFPWESARDGRDVTPRWARIGTAVLPVRTGDQEEHVTADVAWAAWCYAEWTGDQAWLRGAGRPLVVETARYWASRCRTDTAGRAHIDQVIGPDEYHEQVDDNAYTNVMARWNLRRGADLLTEASPSSPEASAWRELADRLVDGYDPATGVYEQHRGYHGLEALSAEDLGRVPVAADLLLPHERLAGSQIVKQADVLMLHHLVPDEVEPGSLRPNLRHYLPRTAHGSSLSPAVTASLLFRDGRHDEGVALLRTALRIDLDDLTGATPVGLHVAAQGGTWQALVRGVAGLQVRDGALVVEPSVPPAWGRVGIRLRCLGRRVRIEVDGDRASLSTDRVLAVWDGGRRRPVRGRVDLRRGEEGWTMSTRPR